MLHGDEISGHLDKVTIIRLLQVTGTFFI